MTTRIEKAERVLEDLKGQERALREQAVRHRTFGESDRMIQRELTATRGAIYHARRALTFSRRVP